MKPHPRILAALRPALCWLNRLQALGVALAALECFAHGLPVFGSLLTLACVTNAMETVGRRLAHAAMRRDLDTLAARMTSALDQAHAHMRDGAE